MFFLKYYYYRLYKYFSNGDEIPFFSAFLVIAVFGYFNLMTIVELFSIIVNKEFELPVMDGIGKFWPAIFLLPAFWLFHYYMKTLGNHSKIIDEFDRETAKKKVLANIWVIAYFVTSIGLFILVLWLRQTIRGY